ncbi:hypothetical protein CVT91_00170 [Candidatus Atribacteria bacterium HGW-Atribacteria-1]|nr:MAG: hypothetical protein CVT91_00170 [Candidatus Atribacteria bacterium HGW-Atribacteria-1]
MANIDIGNVAENRTGSWGTTNITMVERDNPANLSGKITSVEIWAYSDMTNVEVAIFYVVSGNNLSTRSNAYIGNVTSGAKRTFTVSLDVEAGDYIGIYWYNGDMEETSSGVQTWYLAGDSIPCTNLTFTLTSGSFTHSLYGTGVRILSIAGAITFVGTLAKIKLFIKALAGAITFVGTLTKINLFIKALAGAITFVGTLATIFTKTKLITGALTFTSVLAKKTSISLSGSLTFIGSLVKKISISLSGAVSFIGRLFSNTIYNKVSKMLSTYTKITKAISDYIKRDKDKGEEL